MALQRGNRTYYNPANGVEWRNSLLPFNTLYALLAFSVMVFLGIILKVCYMAYRSEIHRLEDRQKMFANMKVANRGQPNGYPMGILKTANGIRKCPDSKAVDDDKKMCLKVKFMKGERSDVEPCKVGEYKKIDCNERPNDVWSDYKYFSCHL